MLELIWMSTSMVSPYKSLKIWVAANLHVAFLCLKRFFEYLVYEIFLWPEIWRGSLHIYLLPFPRFWTLSVERFWFLFWSILNGVTLKTSNSWIFVSDFTAKIDLSHQTVFCRSNAIFKELIRRKRGAANTIFFLLLSFDSLFPFFSFPFLVWLSV